MTEEKKEENYLDRYVEPHKKVSREVKEKDLKRVISEAHILYNLCFASRGFYEIRKKGDYHFAIAHPQIDDKDPLRFFVTADKDIVINPSITRHSNYTVKDREGCMSFPNNLPATVERWQKIEVECQTLDSGGKLTDKINLKLSGKDAKIYQHETEHLDAKYIYEIKEYVKER